MYKRIIGLILMDGGIFCRTRNFIPDYHYTHQFIDSTYFDELVCINVSQRLTKEQSQNISDNLEAITKESQLPISIGGGIDKVYDVELFRNFGADRYLLNQTQDSSDDFVSECIDKYGKSTIISSINHWGPFTATKSGVLQKKVVDRIAEIRDQCGGDILLNSMERDGTLRGLDLELVDELSQISDLKFILSGGVGNLEHLVAALQRENVVGVCTSNVYHLTTDTISNWRAQMIARGLPVREI